MEFDIRTYLTWLASCGLCVPPRYVGEAPPLTLQFIALLLQQFDRSGSPDLAAEPKYLRTGDLGRIDTERLLYVEGRHKDLIITNGRNIYPQVTWRIDWWSRYSYAMLAVHLVRKPRYLV